ncbi:MAG: anhydro-N-acetylmuramic acid kinase [Wenzhouxiangellaceae bacterium]
MTDGYFIGLISGTSMDAVDAALINIRDGHPHLLQALSHTYPESIRETLLQQLHQPEQIPFGEIIAIELQLADCFAAAVDQLLHESSADRQLIKAIGSHGQTLCHRPQAQPPYTIQLGDNARLAVTTGIDVIGDFRRADLADHGHAAPLAPLLHQQLLGSDDKRIGVLNIGGIANLTVLGESRLLSGFDTGPGNALMDQWCRRHHQEAYDADGRWAASGVVNTALLQGLRQEPYFAAAPPKSTGREAFNLHWLSQQAPALESLPAADVQATLLELTVTTIADAVTQKSCDQVYVCGGGVHNRRLMQRLSSALNGIAVASTASVGIDPDWVEATLFGWLAWRHLNAIPSDLRPITGSRQQRVLGARWPA